MEQQNLENVQPDVSIAPAQTEAYTSALTDTKVLNTLNKMAGMFARSRIVPELYQNSIDNCFVACELANRMGVSPMIVMQNLYIVKGKPTWSGSACISLINGNLNLKCFGQWVAPVLTAQVHLGRRERHGKLGLLRAGDALVRRRGMHGFDRGHGDGESRGMARQEREQMGDHAGADVHVPSRCLFRPRLLPTCAHGLADC